MVVRGVRGFLRDHSGVSSVELALLTPLLVGMLLMMTDIGMAVRQRMVMDHILRLGAEAAMRGAGSTQIVEALEAAVADHATARMAGLQVATPVRSCRCAESGAAAVDCARDCADGAAPDVLHALSATLPYRSLFLGERLDITLRSTLMVQVLPDFAP